MSRKYCTVVFKKLPTLQPKFDMYFSKDQSSLRPKEYIKHVFELIAECNGSRHISFSPSIYGHTSHDPSSLHNLKDAESHSGHSPSNEFVTLQ